MRLNQAFCSFLLYFSWGNSYERTVVIETSDIQIGEELVRIQPAYLMKGVLFMEEVFAKYEDTAGNLHWYGTETGEHIIKKQDPLSNFQIPNKCKYCGYYYNFLCRAEQCINDGNESK